MVRTDAERGAGQEIMPVSDDLAVDGIEELLKVFAAFCVAEWGEYFVDVLGESPGRTYSVQTAGAAWWAASGPRRFTVEDGHIDNAADVHISDSPARSCAGSGTGQAPTP